LGGQQVATGPVDERSLVVAADLHEGHMGETGLWEGADGIDERVEIVTTDGRRHVVGRDELGGAGEGSRPGQLRVDLPGLAASVTRGL
jgi:hypothetical protein